LRVLTNKILELWSGNQGKEGLESLFRQAKARRRRRRKEAANRAKVTSAGNSSIPMPTRRTCSGT